MAARATRRPFEGWPGGRTGKSCGNGWRRRARWAWPAVVSEAKRMKLIDAELSPTDSACASARRGRRLRIVVIGSGYVGLVTAACLASCGHAVVGVDADEAKVACLATARCTVYEAGLEALVEAQLAAGRLRFTSRGRQALRSADLVFVAVGTPARRDGSTEMSAIDAAIQEIAAVVRAPTVVVIKSTVPVGTTQDLQRRLDAALDAACARGSRAARVLSNPEFLREGTAVADFMQPQRIIVGDDGAGDAARRVLLDAYAPWLDAGVPVLVMDTRSAELSKHAANAALAMRISFVNEIAAIAAATGADIEKVCDGIGSDRRIGRSFLRAGLGYGGSCFPKDVAALRDIARRHKVRSDLLQATERVNDRQRCWAFDELQRDLGARELLRGLRVAIWGLAFKPGTDDVRCAPSLTLADRLVRAGVAVALYDPVAMANARAEFDPARRVRWAASASDALAGADVLMLVTEWPEFVEFDPAAVAAALRLKCVYDGRNALDVARWNAAGLRVVQVGRPPATSLSRGTRLTLAAEERPRRVPLRSAGALDMAAWLDEPQEDLWEAMIQGGVP
jgi:UDPglucose 6-dehydrogenase